MQAPPLNTDDLVKRSGWTDPWESPNDLWPVVEKLKNKIIDSLEGQSKQFFRRENDYFESITSVSGALYPIPKPQRKEKLREKLHSLPLLSRLNSSCT